VDYSYTYSLESLEILKQTPFDYLYNLDKDREACSLVNSVKAKKKKGFHLVDGFCQHIDDDAKSKWITGLFDDENIRNKKSYPEEIFEICGFEYKKEEYLLEIKEKRDWNFPKDTKIIGLNTGCGERWQTRLWPDEHWIALSNMLKNEGYEVLLLGGPQEDKKNKRIAQKAKVEYPGYFPVPVFIDLMNQCQLVVTAVTMALHIALGLKKQVVLFNNIFNRHEFEMFERGVILEPPKECKGCYKNACDEACMELITPEEVAANVGKLLGL
jgi:heptosyltransferase-2